MLILNRRLYLIEILHQTTTEYMDKVMSAQLYLIEILHQTTTSLSNKSEFISCILLKFYIKPQLRSNPFAVPTVVSY